MVARLLALALALAGCNSAIDVTATRGAVSFHFNDEDCAVGYSGNRGAGPSAVDITCPVNLRPTLGRPTLHISTPLVTSPGELPLRDEHFRKPGYQLGHFVVITYQEGGRRVTCDSLQATGVVIYRSVPRPGTAERLAGHFSDDAALLNCHPAQSSDGNVPLALRGSFDIAAP